MTKAICFKCGSDKSVAFTACEQCGAVPRTQAEHALSLALCEHLSSGKQLAPARSQTAPPESSNRHLRKLKETALHRNAFWLLGATTRDDRRRIVELAESKALDHDHDTCQKARADLTSSRTRLAVELAWLPGVSPKKAALLVQQVLKDPLSVRSESGLPPLAHANLMAAAFEAVDAQDSATDIASFIQEMAHLVDKLSVDDVLRDINEDRAVSGFPEIKAREQVDGELADRKRHFRGVIKESLDRLPPPTLVDAMTRAVDGVTAGGAQHAPELIDELVDSYEVGVQEFLHKEAENIHKLIQATRDCAKAGEGAVKPLVDKLESVARNWDKVAQPIQLSAKARGIQHQSSNEVAFSILSLAVDLFNEHDMLPQAQRITGLLQELFSELPELAERVEQYVGALEDIFHNRKHAETRRKEWGREITYRTDIGMLFKDTLSISPNGVSWKDQHYPLDAITRVRWGGIRHSVNGIPTGTTYTLAFGDNNSEAVVELKRQEVYTTFLDKLWRAVCVRLLAELLEALSKGREIRFGDAVVRDDGITLTKHKFLGTEQVQCTWYQTQVWTADGAFYIGAKEDKKAYAALSYINTPNVHILEQAIRMVFKKAGMRGLSDLLKDD